LNVLIIAAHPDDEVLGCGGTIARHVVEGDEVRVLFVADGETARAMHNKENRNIAAKTAGDILGISHIHFLDHPDQRLDQISLLDLTRQVEEHIAAIKPRTVYTHHAGDLNEDHKIVHQIAMTALRPLPGSSVKEIYAFEVPSSTEWGTGFSPNHFVNISALHQRKVEALSCYESEMRAAPHARSYSAIGALNRLRGHQVGFAYAEAFMTLRTIR
jgi:LmbE family N-acetylglucosaminyl deacetylase